MLLHMHALIDPYCTPRVPARAHVADCYSELRNIILPGSRSDVHDFHGMALSSGHDFSLHTAYNIYGYYIVHPCWI